jgi:hypothetical protein
VNEFLASLAPGMVLLYVWLRISDYIEQRRAARWMHEEFLKSTPATLKRWSDLQFNATRK